MEFPVTHRLVPTALQSTIQEERAVLISPDRRAAPDGRQSAQSPGLRSLPAAAGREMEQSVIRSPQTPARVRAPEQSRFRAARRLPSHKPALRLVLTRFSDTVKHLTQMRARALFPFLQIALIALGLLQSQAAQAG